MRCGAWAFASGLALTSAPASASKVTVTNNGAVLNLDVISMEVHVPPQCETKYCDSADTNCDGVLDEACPGLEYNVCKDGSIVKSYMDAALTGFCLEDKPEPQCDGLVISPATRPPECGG